MARCQLSCGDRERERGAGWWGGGGESAGTLCTLRSTTLHTKYRNLHWKLFSITSTKICFSKRVLTPPLASLRFPRFTVRVISCNYYSRHEHGFVKYVSFFRGSWTTSINKQFSSNYVKSSRAREGVGRNVLKIR